MKMIAFFATIACIIGYVSTARIEMMSRCQFPIWPAILGTTVPLDGGVELGQWREREFEVPDDWDGRIWARTGCGGEGKNFYCETGDCGNGFYCNGSGWEAPATVAEITLMAVDKYSVSLVDGFNVPIYIEPKFATYIYRKDTKACQRAGACVLDLKALCPPRLRVVRNGETIGCKTTCDEFDEDAYCQHTAALRALGSSFYGYASLFKTACPTAKVTARDPSGTFECTGGWMMPKVIYRVMFC